MKQYAVSLVFMKTSAVSMNTQKTESTHRIDFVDASSKEEALGAMVIKYNGSANLGYLFSYTVMPVPNKKEDKE